jgi:2'-5' RNA ligase/GNAT superfamily N-acetyltransferase
VLLLPEPVGSAVDVLRRALGADDVDRLPSHLTLVPPVNVRDDDMDSALDLLRDVAERTSPFPLRLGPTRTFLPTNPVLYLEVGGDVAPVDKVRDKIFRPPLERNLTWPFHPHVTLLDNGDESKIRSAVDALADVRFECVIDRVHLLQESNDDGVRSWHPIAEATFGARAVVGRGGLELDLDVTERLPLDAVAFSDRAWAAEGDPWPKAPLAVTARRDRRIVGTADGDTRPNGEAHLAHLIVAGDVRGEGVGAHLVAAFSSAAAERGCTFVSLRTEQGGPAVPFYERLGFEEWYVLPRWRSDRDYVQMRRQL